MALADITRDAVERAISECDKLGRDAFLSKYGFKRARKYLLLENGKEYDSKAIAGVAHGYLQGGSILQASQFAGGEKAAAGRLKQLGFDIRGPEWKVARVPSYEPGAVYSRRKDIHAHYHGQRQGGISTPRFAPLVFLFTGESGDQFGYQDGPQDDGTFSYTGEGQVGSMEFVRGNRAIRDHIKDGRDLLLFEKLHKSGYYRFIGYFTCESYEFREGADKRGDIRKIIVFRLRPKTDGEEPELSQAVAELRNVSLDELRVRAIEDATEDPVKRVGTRSYVQRSASVRAYVLKRASGVCESCGVGAPFIRISGEPYLEPHHTRRLADGGPDHPDFVAAVCPTCHREIHYGKDGYRKNEDLKKKIKSISHAI